MDEDKITEGTDSIIKSILILIIQIYWRHRSIEIIDTSQAPSPTPNPGTNSRTNSRTNTGTAAPTPTPTNSAWLVQ